MSSPSLRPLALLLVAASFALTACRYPDHAYAYDDLGRPVGRGIFRPASTTAYSPLGAAASSVLGSNRDHYYYVISGSNAGTRYYSARPYYGTGARPGYGSPARRLPIYRVTYERHPYYSNPLYSSPYYSRSPTYYGSYNHRPWGGGYGFGQPYSQPLNWGTGLALGSRWF
ncbi:hypothetical protein [Prosthecobacter sp.]|uniref:hypothetical protein n=1 Tax=Prosthecobacter sp. TaxID=1965333 RepID=UPI00378344F5